MVHRSISVVIPVFNSERTLEELVRRLAGTLETVAQRHELILVDDGSTDGSAEICRRLEAKEPWVRALALMKNFGQHNALLCGIRQASGEVIITLDDDLQNPPEEIPKLVEALTDGVDVVYGTPVRERHGVLRDLASVVTKLALRTAMGIEMASSVSTYRAFRSGLRAAFDHYDGSFVCIDVLLTWGTTRFTAVPVDHHPRKDGPSNYNFRKLLRHALNMATGFSVLPLQVASLIGLSFTVVGLLLLCFIIGRYLIEGSVVSGFAFLASTISMFAGVQLFSLGVIGEYLARMHFRLMGKPAYVLRGGAEAAPSRSSLAAGGAEAAREESAEA